MIFIDSQWTQYRMTVGAPDAEAKFKKALDLAAQLDENAATYPVIYVCVNFEHQRF